MGETSEKIKQIRFDRMRQGKGACEIVSLASAPEVRFALVPLTEGEFDAAHQAAVQRTNDMPETFTTITVFEREFRRQIVFLAAREINNLEEHVFSSLDEVNSLDAADVAAIYEDYRTFTENSNPSLENFKTEELDELKKAFVEADWNGLSGKSWSLLKRFLGSLQAEQLQDNSPGFFSTS